MSMIFKENDDFDIKRRDGRYEILFKDGKSLSHNELIGEVAPNMYFVFDIIDRMLRPAVVINCAEQVPNWIELDENLDVVGTIRKSNELFFNSTGIKDLSSGEIARTINRVMNKFVLSGLSKSNDKDCYSSEFTNESNEVDESLEYAAVDIKCYSANNKVDNKDTPNPIRAITYKKPLMVDKHYFRSKEGYSFKFDCGKSVIRWTIPKPRFIDGVDRLVPLSFYNKEIMDVNKVRYISEGEEAIDRLTPIFIVESLRVDGHDKFDEEYIIRYLRLGEGFDIAQDAIIEELKVTMPRYAIYKPLDILSTSVDEENILRKIQKRLSLVNAKG